MSKKAKIYIDCDGVLADFDTAYDILIGGKEKRPDPSDDDAFWNPIIASLFFWLGIDVLPDARELWDYCNANFDHVAILTSPGRHDVEKAIRQKRIWISSNFGPSANVIFKYSKEKHLYACPNSILIDDWHENVSRWNEAGGHAIRHRNATDTISAIQTILSKMETTK